MQVNGPLKFKLGDKIPDEVLSVIKANGGVITSFVGEVKTELNQDLIKKVDLEEKK